MASFERRVASELWRAQRPENELLAEGDLWALYEKRGLGRWGESRAAQTVGLIGRLGLTMLNRATLRPHIWVDPILVQPTWFGKKDTPILHSKDGMVWPLAGRYLEVSYYGDIRSVPRLKDNLADVAAQLSAFPKALPKYIIGMSNRDMVSVAARMLGLPMHFVSEVKDTRVEDVLEVADIVREIQGRRPLQDRKIYAMIMPTDAFIDRFASTNTPQVQA